MQFPHSQALLKKWPADVTRVKTQVLMLELKTRRILGTLFFGFF